MRRLLRHLFSYDNAVTLMILAGIIAAIFGCHGDKAKPEAPPAPRLIVEKRPCVVQPPPTPTPGGVTYDAGSEDGPCPAGYVMCIPHDGMIQLLTYLDAVHRWAGAVFVACGPPPAPAAPATTPGGVQ